MITMETCSELECFSLSDVMLVDKSLLVGLDLVILLVLQPVHRAGLVTATRQHVKEAPHSTRLLHVTTQEKHTGKAHRKSTQTPAPTHRHSRHKAHNRHAPLAQHTLSQTQAPPRGVYAPAPCHGRKC